MTNLDCLKVVEFLVSVNEPDEHTKPELLLQIVHDVYATVHSHMKDHSCHYVHKDWRNRGEELLNAAKQAGFMQ